MSSFRKKPLSILRELIILSLIVGVVFVGNKAVNSWLGQKALEAVQLEYTPYEAALQKAKLEDKRLMLEFSAIWCPSCRKLDKKVLADTEVSTKIRSDYIFTRLDYDVPEDKLLFEQYNVKSFPTLIVIDPDTASLKRLATTFDPQQFLSQL